MMEFNREQIAMAIKILEGAEVVVFNRDFDEFQSAIITAINALTLVEELNKVKHGYWIKASCSEKDGDANCSECNHWDWSDCKYCSECGAKMGDRDGEIHLPTDFCNYGERED